MIPLNFDSIPQELKLISNWVLWNLEERYGKMTKVPYQINGQRADTTDPDTWGSYDAVKQAYLRGDGKFSGIGFVFSEDTGIMGIDWDKVKNGEWGQEAFAEIKSCGSYAELSQSGTGAHVYIKGKLPSGRRRKDNIEMYSEGRFFAVTGQHIKGTPLTLNEAQEAINALYKKHFPFQTTALDDSILPKTRIVLSDEGIIQLLENWTYSEQFKNLFYNGNLSKFDNDHSKADWNLCRMFIYYTQEPEQVDRLFRKSALIRPKWDEIHGEGTYGEITINNCLLARKNVYMGGPYIGNNLLTYEYPYRVTDTGIYKIKPTKSTGDSTIEIDQEICSTSCTIIAVGRNLDNGELLYKLSLRDPEDIKKEIWKGSTELLQRKGVLQLQEEGLLFTESNAGDLTEFFKTLIRKLTKTLPKEYAASKSGWKKDCSLFVVGDKAISANGVVTVLQRDNPTAELYIQKGDLNSWIEAAKILLTYNSVRFKLYSSCVPPLLKLLNMPSFVETQQVKSGNLKTTTGWLAASVWGDPERLQINAASTAIGITKTVEFCTDLPIFVDETSISDSIKDLVYTVANGVGRSKGNSEGGLVMPSTWSTVLLTTGEKPILPESALTGQQVRVVPLREGVNKKLKPELVNCIQTTIKTNYGHVGILFLQELFKEKDNLASLYQNYFKAFPEVETEDITSDRAKGYYAVIAVAGYLLEKVFKNIGIEVKNPYAVCEYYFNENVISNSFVPDHIKALSAAYSWFSANEVYFREGEEYPINHERYGWVRDDCVCFIPDKLKKCLNTEIGPNTYEAATEEWKALEILIPKMQSKKDKEKGTSTTVILTKNQISVKGLKEPVIKIPFAKFTEYLKLEDENEKKPSTVKNQEDNPQSPSDWVKTANSANVPEEIVWTTANTITVVSDDAELAEIMKQEGF